MNQPFFICVVLFLSMQACAFAQPDFQSATQDRGPEVHDVPERSLRAIPRDARDRPEGLIKLDVMVADAAGKPAAGLNASDFHLLENGREQKILSFEAFNGEAMGPEPAVKIILLIDTLELSPNLARDERLAVESFLRKNGGRLSHPVSVFELTDTGLWTLSHPSNDGNSLAHEIDHNTFTVVRRNTPWQRQTEVATHPSEFALRALGQIATDERRMPGRKLLVWVGPGWGIGTGALGDLKHDSKLFGTICWFSDLLREAHVAVYSFSVGEMNTQGHVYKDYLSGVPSEDKATLMSLNRKVLAAQSGGRVIEPGPEIEQEIERCVEEAGPFYRISFDPFRAERLDEYHDLHVEVDDPRLSARTTTGYYDEPYYSADQIPPLKRISLDELRTILELDESDAEKAKQLTGVELTERLSERRLASLFAIAHGKKTRQELRILADASSFLKPPADEIPADAPPDEGEQQRMLELTATYLKTTIHKLPDLFAERATVRYQETPMYLEGDVNYQPLHITDNWKTTIRYRNGAEVAETKPPKRKRNEPELITYGVFGPALSGALDALSSKGAMTWSHWEQGARGRIAVFRYAVPTVKSLHQVWLCCVPDGDGTQAFQRYAGFHEEIGIDPESGAILRLTLQTDLLSTTPSTRSDVMIEYGPVDIGGTTYICPLRSVSMMRARSVRVRLDWDEFFRAYGPYATMLNDVTFDRYHVFRSNSRVLTGSDPGDKQDY